LLTNSSDQSIDSQLVAIDIFLKLDGAAGESKDKVHSKKIDVLSWSWGMANSGSAHVGGGGGSGKVNVQDVSLCKYIDSSSPKLMLAAIPFAWDVAANSKE
jgi:type VI secretion system secreted protein Hcp